jgi:toxin ParE1/3/4
VRRLSILPAARVDLIEIGDFIATDNPDRAVSFVAEIEAKIIKVATRPESFPARDELHEGLRSARPLPDLFCRCGQRNPHRSGAARSP